MVLFLCLIDLHEKENYINIGKILHSLYKSEIISLLPPSNDIGSMGKKVTGIEHVHSMLLGLQIAALVRT
jgi:hypothetical protein